jgi:hypothetical protein
VHGTVRASICTATCKETSVLATDDGKMCVPSKPGQLHSPAATTAATTARTASVHLGSHLAQLQLTSARAAGGCCCCCGQAGPLACVSATMLYTASASSASTKRSASLQERNTIDQGTRGEPKGRKWQGECAGTLMRTTGIRHSSTCIPLLLRMHMQAYPPTTLSAHQCRTAPLAASNALAERGA